MLPGTRLLPFLALAACRVGLEGAPCPCAEGTVCCTATNECLASAADCPDSVLLTSVTGKGFWIDRYEASLLSGSFGDLDLDQDGDGLIADPVVVEAHRESHEFELDSDEPAFEETTAIVQSVADEPPLVEVSYFAAARACANSGKRLCTAEEWTAACEGRARRNYPYGDTYMPDTCWDSRSVPVVQETGSLPSCRTEDDVYDLSGNVGELAGQGVYGGSYFDGPEDGHLCCSCWVGPVDRSGIGIALGFRCCRDP